MEESLFPIRPKHSDIPQEVLAIEPYCEDGIWMFDDPVTGLEREPFVGEVNDVINQLTIKIPQAQSGFRLLFADRPFEGYADSLTWLRADPVEGNWYRSETSGKEGWLCPALFFYFPTAPATLFVQAMPRQVQ
jgi:hypothetical protein